MLIPPLDTIDYRLWASGFQSSKLSMFCEPLAPTVQMDFRRILAEASWCTGDPLRMDDYEVMNHIASGIQSCRLLVINPEPNSAVWVEQWLVPANNYDLLDWYKQTGVLNTLTHPRHRSSGWKWKRLAEKPQKPEKQPKKHLSTPDEVAGFELGFKVIDHRDGSHIPGVNLEITMGDESHAIKTIAEGWAKHKGERPRNFSLSSSWRGLSKSQCVKFIGFGELDHSKKAVSEPDYEDIQAVVTLLEHKVQEGDTLDTIAASYEYTPEDVAKFNWNTTDPAEINQKLIAAGASRKDGRGNPVFAAGDKPGIVQIPVDWRQDGLVSGQGPLQTYCIQVAPIGSLGGYIFHYQVDLDSEWEDDILILETVDKSWRSQVSVKDFKIDDEGWATIEFPMPPSEPVNLIQDPGDGLEQVMVYEAFKYEDLELGDLEYLEE